MNEVKSVVLLVLLGLFTLPVDGAAQWQRTRFGMLELSEHIRDIVFTSPEDCFFVLEKGIGRSLSRGRFTKRTWLELTWSDSSLRAVVFPTKNVGYAVGSRIWKTTDAGDTWSLTESQPECWDTEVGGLALVYRSVDSVVVASGRCGSNKTIDGGRTWLKGSSNNMSNMLSSVSISEAGGSILWLATTISGSVGNMTWLFRSSDGGSQWVRDDVWMTFEFGSAVFRAKRIQFVDENRGWVVGHRPKPTRAGASNNGRVFRTTDAGQSWDTTSYLFANNVNCIAFENESIGYIGDVAGNIYSTTDGGDTWQNDSVPSGGRAINAIAFTGGGEVYAVGDNGLILRRDVPTSVREQDTKPALRLYPNPTTGVFTVESSSGPAELYVVDVLGSIVLQTTVDARSTLDLSAQPPAMYRVLMRTSQGVVAQTVAVVR